MPHRPMPKLNVSMLRCSRSDVRFFFLELIRVDCLNCVDCLVIALSQTEQVDLLIGQSKVAEVANDFQDFAARREHASALSLVIIHRTHELDLRIGIVAFAGGRIDVPATLFFSSRVFHHTDVQGVRITAATFRGGASAIKRDDLLGRRTRVRTGGLVGFAFRRCVAAFSAI